MPHSNPLTRRAVLVAAAGATLPFACPAANSPAAWPDHPIRMIIPFASGGGTDVIGRAIGAGLSAQLGQPIFIDNKGGAGGNIGYDAVAKAPADGYTLMLMTMAFATNAASGRKFSFDPMKDFVPIGQIGSTPLAIVVSRDSPVKTLRELIELARATPNGVSYGSNGPGSMSHLGAELLAAEAKVQMLHVPYKGISQALTDLMAGRVTMAVTSFAATSSLVKGGRLRCLAVTSTKRTSAEPDVPTTTEAGLPGFKIDFWYGLMAPAQLPTALVKRLNDELNITLARAELREMLASEAGVPMPGTPEQFSKLLSFEVTRWGKLIKDANISFE